VQDLPGRLDLDELDEGRDPGVLQEELTTNPCADGAYVLHGHRWATTLVWSLNMAGRTDLSTTHVLASIVHGAADIIGAVNDCGRPDGISAYQSYAGTTTASPQISAPNGVISCLGRDARNVVGFASMSPFKAVTCWYWDSTGYLVESDIAFAQSASWQIYPWVFGCPSGGSAYDMAAVATHEFGHAYGLLHPGTDHPSLTMQPGGPCDASKRTLGLGDMLGLEALY
jgi:hypothetical protein